MGVKLVFPGWGVSDFWHHAMFVPGWEHPTLEIFVSPQRLPLRPVSIQPHFQSSLRQAPAPAYSLVDRLLRPVCRLGSHLLPLAASRLPSPTDLSQPSQKLEPAPQNPHRAIRPA